MAETRTTATPGIIKLSPLKSADIPVIVEMEKACFPDDPWPTEAFTQELRNEFSRPLVAREQGGRLVGYMITWVIGPEVHIANIAVDPACRGLGYGRAMMMQAIQIARDGKAEEMVLEVRVSNEPAIGLYASLGFKPVYTRRNYYRNGEDAVVMAMLIHES